MWRCLFGTWEKKSSRRKKRAGPFRVISLNVSAVCQEITVWLVGTLLRTEGHYGPSKSVTLKTKPITNLLNGEQLQSYVTVYMSGPVKWRNYYTAHPRFVFEFWYLILEIVKSPRCLFSPGMSLSTFYSGTVLQDISEVLYSRISILCFLCCTA